MPQEKMTTRASEGLKKIGKAVTRISEDSRRTRSVIVSKGGDYHYTVRKVPEAMPEPTTTTDLTEDAAIEIADTCLYQLDGETSLNWQRAAAIIRRHMAEHLQRLHDEVMNLRAGAPYEDYKDLYKRGHRDARHAAAAAVITSLNG